MKTEGDVTDEFPFSFKLGVNTQPFKFVGLCTMRKCQKRRIVGAIQHAYCYDLCVLAKQNMRYREESWNDRTH